MNELTSEERLRLMRFVCSFAWADLEIRDEERALVGRLSDQLQLNHDEREQVSRWLMVPPLPEEVDPQEIPVEHRRMFIAAAQAVISIDGEVLPDELAFLDLFTQLLLGDLDEEDGEEE